MVDSRDPKLFWKAVQESENSQRTSKIQVKKDGSKLTNAEAVEGFDTFFEAKVKRLSNNAGPFVSNLLNNPGARILNQEVVSDAIKALSPKMCMGFNEIPSKALKMVCPFILEETTTFLNDVCVSGIPESWRTAVVRPLHKSGSKRDVSNYRPISTL